MLGNSARRHMDFKGRPCSYGKPSKQTRNAQQNDGIYIFCYARILGSAYGICLFIKGRLPKIDVYLAEWPQEDIITTRIWHVLNGISRKLQSGPAYDWIRG